MLKGSAPQLHFCGNKEKGQCNQVSYESYYCTTGIGICLPHSRHSFYVGEEE